VERGEDQPTCRSSLAGRNTAAPRPISPNTARETIAHAYAWFPVATTETRIVPAIAVPKDEPRLDTLRERPDNLTLQLLGEAGLHDIDRGRQHYTEAQADQKKAGHESHDSRRGADEAEQESDPGQGDDEARHDQGFLRVPGGESLRSKEESRMPTVAAVKTTPVSIAL
jgi:hypothetical protein